ncbi:hypothetical protein BGX24_000995 [Mortierella sp. AD032]|nr:hypothetical protein BGX24_000995 [Mortierella sp. AD032]
MNSDTQEIVKQKDGWNELWRRDIHPWDKGVPSPALVEVIEKKPISSLIPQSGNVLVPGCGRGVDVFYLGNPNRKAYGLDISPIAVQQCKDIRTEKDWGRRMSEIIPKDGILITLMYPIGNHTDGPPFAVSVDHYHSFLDTNFDCLLVDECSSFEARKGKEKVGVWRRK